MENEEQAALKWSKDMLVKTTIISAILTFVIILGCSKSIRAEWKQSRSGSNIDEGNSWVCYVEAHDGSSTISSGNFGDVVLFNCATKQKIRITDDDFIDENPALSPDRKRVIFASAREGDKSLLKIVGLGGPRRLYVIEIENPVIRRFASRLQDDNFQAMHRFLDLQWSPDGRGLYFHNGDRNLYRISTNEDSLNMVLRLDENEVIDQFIVSPNGRSVVIRFDSAGTLYDGVRLYDIHNAGSRVLALEPGVHKLGMWSPDGRKFSYRTYRERNYRWAEYDIATGESHFIKIPGLNEGIEINRMAYLNQNEFVLLAGKLIHPEDPRAAPYSNNLEIATLSMDSLKFKWLTEDGLDKKYLSISQKLK